MTQWSPSTATGNTLDTTLKHLTERIRRSKRIARVDVDALLTHIAADTKWTRAQSLAAIECFGEFAANLSTVLFD